MSDFVSNVLSFIAALVSILTGFGIICQVLEEQGVLPQGICSQVPANRSL